MVYLETEIEITLIQRRQRNKTKIRAIEAVGTGLAYHRGYGDIFASNDYVITHLVTGANLNRLYPFRLPEESQLLRDYIQALVELSARRHFDWHADLEELGISERVGVRANELLQKMRRKKELAAKLEKAELKEPLSITPKAYGNGLKSTEFRGLSGVKIQELAEIWRKLYAGELEPRIGDFIGYRGIGTICGLVTGQGTIGGNNKWPVYRIVMADVREGVIPKDELVFLAPVEFDDLLSKEAD